MTSPAEQRVLEGYVERGLELLETGVPVDPHRLCAEHPHLVEPVAEALGLAAALPGLHQATVRSDRWVGVVLAERYRVDERIGAGAMGSVYRGFDLELGRRVAIKLLQSMLFSDDRAEQRFHRESEVLATLEHEHVVHVFDRGRHDDVPFVVMELLDGPNLAAVLAWSVEALTDGPSTRSFARVDWLAERLPRGVSLESSYLRQVVRWGAELASGLAVAHAHGVFHRDVKPSNVLVVPRAAPGGTRTTRAALVDFGIAARESDDGARTAAGTSLGTPWYMAPEQAAGRAEPTPQLDVYGLTATLYHLLTLRPPFEDEPGRALLRVQTEDPPSAARLHPGLPRDLQAILECGMEREPRHRYADAHALERDLLAFLDHAPVSVRPIGSVRRLVRATRRRPAIASAVAAILVAIVSWIVVVPLAREVRAARDLATWDEARAEVPALLTLEGYPDKRLLIDDFERVQAEQLLTRLLRLNSNDHGNRLVRAALRLDRGDRAGAHADLEQLARAPVEDAYLLELTKRYGALLVDAEARGIGALQLLDMPQPSTAVGHLAAGFNALRSRSRIGYQASVWHLEQAGRDELSARDLLLVARLAVGAYQLALDEARELEGVYGRATARTRHVIGAALVGLGRYDEALAPLADAIELAPGRHGPLHNLGVAHLRRGELDRAEELLRRAHALRPWLWNSLKHLAEIASQRGDHAAALDWAEQIPPSGSLGEAWIRPATLAEVHAEHAFRLAASGGPIAAARGPAHRAIELYGQAARNGASGRDRASFKATAAVLRAIADDDRSSLIARFVDALGAHPDRPVQLLNLAWLLPTDGLDREDVDQLRLLLYRLAATLAPGDPRPRAAADALRRRLDGRDPSVSPRLSTQRK